jgi:hypothetical protein
MANYQPSIQERKLKMFEDVCASCGDGGDGGSSAGGAMDAPEDQPTDNNTLLRTLKMLSDKKKTKKKKAVVEDKKELPVGKMIMKASDLETKEESDKDKKMKLLDRARKIRHEIK